MQKKQIEATMIMETDKGKILFLSCTLKVMNSDPKRFSLWIRQRVGESFFSFHLVMNEKEKKQYLEMNPNKIDFDVHYEHLLTRIFSRYSILPHESPIIPIIRYRSGSIRANSILITLFNKMTYTKIIFRKMNGKVIVSMKDLMVNNRGSLILHSLFQSIQQENYKRKIIVTKLVITRNTYKLDEEFKGRKGRNDEKIKKEYLPKSNYEYLYKDAGFIYLANGMELSNHIDANSTSHIQSANNISMSQQISRLYRNNLDSSILDAVDSIPSNLLASKVFRMSEEEIMKEYSLEKMKHPKKCVIRDLNLVMGNFIMKLNRTYFLLHITLVPPAVFEKDFKFNELDKEEKSLQGTWIDKVKFRSQLYNFDILRVSDESEVLVKEIARLVHPTRLGSFYGSMVKEKPSSWFQRVLETYFKSKVYSTDNDLYLSAKISEDRGCSMTEDDAESNLAIGSRLERLGELGRNRNSRLSKQDQVSIAGLDHPEQTGVVRKPSFSAEEKEHSRRITMVEGRWVSHYRAQIGSRQITVKMRYVGGGIRQQTRREEVVLKAFDMYNNENFKLSVRNPDSIARLVSLMDRINSEEPGAQFLKVCTNLILDFRRTINGVKVRLNNIHSRSLPLFRDNSPEHLKYSTFCEFETVYVLNNFIKREIYFTSVTRNLGAVYVSCRLYYSFKLPTSECVFLLNLQPLATRFTSHKIILNANDIRLLSKIVDMNLEFHRDFDRHFFNIIQDENNPQIIKLLNSVVAEMSLVKGQVFSKLSLPCYSVDNYNSILQNVFEEKNLFGSQSKSEEKKQGKVQYLTRKIDSNSIIVKCPMRYNNQYWVVTVVDNEMMDRIDIQCYVPSTSRRFVCTLSKIHDLPRVGTGQHKRPKDMSFLNRVEERTSSFKNYNEIVEEHGKGKSTDLSKRIQRRTKSYVGSRNFNKVKFWLDIIKSSWVEVRHKDLIMRLHGFTGILKEKLFQKLCESKDKIYEIIIYLEPKKRTPKSTVPKFDPIYIHNLSNFSLFLKITFLDKLKLHTNKEEKQFHNDKLDLEELFKIYQHQLIEKLLHIQSFTQMAARSPTKDISKQLTISNLISLKNNQTETDDNKYMINQLRLGEMVKLANILGNNIENGYTEKYNHVVQDNQLYFENEKIISKEIIYGEHFERKMKLNSKLYLDIQIDPYYRNYNDILLHKSVFTVIPRRLLVILFNKKGKMRD